ncbi:hypothetical protein [Dysgonomonas sp. 25]|uniref:hypothetical protein n=1 Tax=Dysgonomonas sp. 25 TaxID=2302933 RepID=UPI0013D69A76|nr:hypothetical protein [Dysgonomonas sp. 25]
MKKIILFSIATILCCNAIAQISNIKHYYNSLSKSVLIDSLKSKMINTYQDHYIDSGYPIDSIINKGYLAEISSENSVIVLAPEMKNAANYNFEKDIYDFLTVDTVLTKIVYYNNETSTLTLFDLNTGLRKIEYSKKIQKDMNRAWDYVSKEKPDLLMIESWIFKDKNSDNVNLFLVKDGKIYVYRTKYKDTYELNHFIRKFFKEKEFIEHAILNEKGLMLNG